MKDDKKEQAIQPLTRIQSYLESDIIKTRFADILGERGSVSYISSVLLAVANSPDLQACTPVSIYTSALRAATMRLSVDASTGQAYLVPFKQQATLIVGWKGLYDMAIRTRRYRRIEVHKMYEGETFNEDRLTGAMSIGGAKKSNKVAGWLAIFEMFPPRGEVHGTTNALYMTIEEIHAHKERYSKGYDRPDGAWKKATEAMEKKTVLRILLRTRGYMDPQDEEQLAIVENDLDGIDLPDSGLSFDHEPEPVEAVAKDIPITGELPMTDEEKRIIIEREMNEQPHF